MRGKELTLNNRGPSGISAGRGTLKLYPSHQDGSAGAILTLRDVWYIPQSPANPVSQAKLNDLGVHYNDETWCFVLYDKE